MILDTSALVAILYREPEAAAFAQLSISARGRGTAVAPHPGYSCSSVSPRMKRARSRRSISYGPTQ